AYLKTFLNPKDDISLLRIANVPARGMSDVTMERLLAASQERKCSVFDAMKNPAVAATFQSLARTGIERFVELVETTRAHLLDPAAATNPHALQAWAERFLDHTGYLNDLRRSEKNVEAAEARIRSLKELTATLDATHGDLSLLERLEKFLEEVTLDADREEED